MLRHVASTAETLSRRGIAALLLGMLLVVSGSSAAQAQTWISGVGVAITTNSPKVTWTTAVPSDSQVE